MKIRVLDIETSGDGGPSTAGVCEIGWCDVTSKGGGLIDRPTGWEVGLPHAILVNPGRPISPIVSAIHHIIDEDVCNAIPFEDAWLCASDSGNGEPISGFAAHSAKFERNFITRSMTGDIPWVCTYKGALRLWPQEASHSNQALRYSRRPAGLIRGYAMAAHRAAPDAYVTAFHLRDLLEQVEFKQLVEWSDVPALQAICHIGKETRGKRWTEVDIGFLEWMQRKVDLENADFDEDAVFTMRTELKRREDALRDPNFGRHRP